MSDDQKREETPATPDPITPAESPVSSSQTPDPLPVGAKPATGQTPGLQQQTTVPSRPPIDYAMPAQKSFIPSPALIRNVGCLIKLIAGFTVLICLGYFALVALNPKARQWALQGSRPGPGGAPPSGKGPTPFKTLNQILAIPAQAMGKTDDVVKANNARVGQLDGLVAEEEARTKGGARTSRPVADPFANASPAGGTSRPDNSTADATAAGPQAVSSAAMLALAEKRAAAAASSELPAPQIPDARPKIPVIDPGPQTPDEMKLPGDIIISHASPAGAPRASAAFFFWVVKLNVSGITQSKPARVLLNSRLTYEGDEIHRPLGIVFTRLDPANKLLIFQDATGATVTRSY
jgi:hypothetical protein